MSVLFEALDLSNEFGAFEQLYLDATAQPFNFLYVDSRDNTYRRNFNREYLLKDTDKFVSHLYLDIRPVKKHSKKVKQASGWFFERSDPICGASNRFIGDKVLTPTNIFLIKIKILSSIAGTVGSFLGGPAGAVSGAVASVRLQHGSRVYRTHKPMTGGGSPFLLTNSSSFNSVKF